MKLRDLLRWIRCWDTEFMIQYSGKSSLIPTRKANDHILRQMRKRGTFYELDLLQAIQSRARRLGVAIDVGANIGNHSLFFAGVMGLRVVAFEPIRANLDILLKLVELNGLNSRVEVVPTALSDRTGVVHLSAAIEGNPGTYRISSRQAGSAVTAERLDDALHRLGVPMDEVSVLKIDVEGHELQVIDGASDLISRADPVISVEVFSVSLFDSVLGRLRSAGYRAISVHCATPTVLFSRHGVDAAITVRKHIADYETKGDP